MVTCHRKKSLYSTLFRLWPHARFSRTKQQLPGETTSTPIYTPDNTPVYTPGTKQLAIRLSDCTASAASIHHSRARVLIGPVLIAKLQLQQRFTITSPVEWNREKIGKEKYSIVLQNTGMGFLDCADN